MGVSVEANESLAAFTRLPLGRPGATSSALGQDNQLGAQYRFGKWCRGVVSSPTSSIRYDGLTARCNECAWSDTCTWPYRPIVTRPLLITDHEQPIHTPPTATDDRARGLSPFRPRWRAC